MHGREFRAGKVARWVVHSATVSNWSIHQLEGNWCFYPFFFLKGQLLGLECVQWKLEKSITLSHRHTNYGKERKSTCEAFSSAPIFSPIFNQFQNSWHSVPHINSVILFQHTVHSVSAILSGLVNNKPASHYHLFHHISILVSSRQTNRVSHIKFCDPVPAYRS